jgi:hypothetical protein
MENIQEIGTTRCRKRHYWLKPTSMPIKLKNLRETSHLWRLTSPELQLLQMLVYSTTQQVKGWKIYNAAVAGLCNKYTGNTSEMHIFLKNIKERAQSFGWQGILDIPKGLTSINLDRSVQDLSL